MGQEGVVEINFYDFDRTEPSIYLYDLTTCFNDSSSKFLVFTFPGKYLSLFHIYSIVDIKISNLLFIND